MKGKEFIMKNKTDNVRRKNFVFGFGLLGVFAAFYFGSAILTTAELKEIAGITILGLPLIVWKGFITILSGVIIARICLVRAGKS